MKTRYGLALAAAGLLTATGCGFESVESLPTTSQTGDTTTSGIALTIDIQGDTDVAGFRFVIETCGGAPVALVDRDLEDLTLPGGLPLFEDEPFDADSSHLFSDYFTVLPPGCYNVVAQPITAEGDDSEDCGAASANNVTVNAEQTTEILLISQCEGPDVGALDVIAALQHPPEIESLVYNKFFCIGDSVTICATASDPNNDPLDFKWRRLSGPDYKLMKSKEVISSQQVNGAWEECIELTPDEVGTHTVELVVRDMIYNKYGKLRPANYESYTRLTFPLHVADCDPIGGGPDDDDEPKKKKRKKKKRYGGGYNNTF